MGGSPTAEGKTQPSLAERERTEAAARDAQEQLWRDEGRVRVIVGPPGREETRWLLAGGGKDAKETFRDHPRGPEMVVIPPGVFTMGGTESDNEKPPHGVHIAEPFAVARFAATFDEWDAAVLARGVTHKPSDEGWGRGKRPVLNVSWDDAQEYVTWLSKTTGKPYRLLSEAEWEYACRAGTATPFWWGKAITPAQANYDGNHVYEGGGSTGEYRQQTVPVDSFEPNPWGLYQVHGNVWEWCEDCWNESYTGAPDDGSAWMTGDCAKRVLRGGSWDDGPRILRSAIRGRYGPGGRGGNLGFRLARTLTL